MLAMLTQYLAPLNQSREVADANEAARQQGLIDEMKHWTKEAARATENSDRWHECMDELDTVKTLMRKS